MTFPFAQPVSCTCEGKLELTSVFITYITWLFFLPVYDTAQLSVFFEQNKQETPFHPPLSPPPAIVLDA